MVTQEFKQGDIIFREGEAGNTMYIIMEGTVEVLLGIKKTPIRLAIMQKGDFFGEMSIFGDKPRSATVRAIAPVKVALVESKQQLDRFLLKNPAFAAKMVHIMSERLAHTNNLLIEKSNFVREVEYRAQSTSV